MKNIYDLELFEETTLFNNDAVSKSIMRVPGGWIFLYSNPVSSTSSFIPYSNEYIRSA